MIVALGREKALEQRCSCRCGRKSGVHARLESESAVELGAAAWAARESTPSLPRLRSIPIEVD